MRIILILLIFLLVSTSAFSKEKVGASACYDRLSDSQTIELVKRNTIYRHCVTVNSISNYHSSEDDLKTSIEEARKSCKDAFIYARDFLTDTVLCTDQDAVFLMRSIVDLDGEKLQKEVLTFARSISGVEPHYIEVSCAERNNMKPKAHGFIKKFGLAHRCLANRSSIKILSGETKEPKDAVKMAIDDCLVPLSIPISSLMAAGCSEDDAIGEVFNLILQMEKSIIDFMYDIYIVGIDN